jgi:D-serine deaminase-like pyridoxal phosphate-dependent protein
MHNSDVPTPYLRIDTDRVHRNVARMATYAAKHGLGLRPHTKTHKSLWLARAQLNAGAVGLTVAKVGEGEVMVDAAEDVDLLIAYPALDPARTGRIAKLALRTTMRVAVDSLQAAQALAAAAGAAGTTIGLLIDLDVGMGRTGVPSPTDALELALAIDRVGGVRVDGLFCYPGHIWDQAEQQDKSLNRTAERLEEAISLFDRNGLDRGIVSGGSTPTAYQSHLVPQLTEIRPGTYVFNDMNTVRGGFCGLDECAAAIVCTVVSNAVPGQFVLDGGTKTLTSDRCLPDRESGHGHLIEYPDALIARLSEEHAQVDASRCTAVPMLGERVTIVPNHICTCVNLQDAVWWTQPGGQLKRMAVDARGRLS